MNAVYRNKLKASEYRGEQAEMNIQRLNVRIDQVSEDGHNELQKQLQRIQLFSVIVSQCIIAMECNFSVY